MRRGRSLRFCPPNRKIAGRPSETETMGAAKSRSLRSWCKRQARARLVAVDEAGIGREAGKSRRARRARGERRETRAASPAKACPLSGSIARRSDSRVRSVTQPAAPQFVIATDMRKPPGVTMWRKGAAPRRRPRATAVARSSRAHHGRGEARAGQQVAPLLLEHGRTIASALAPRDDRHASCERSEAISAHARRGR